jgi:DNA topoisomerase-3
MTVILAEKPDQARKLASPFPHSRQKSHITIQNCSQFPKGAVVVWAIGHLVQLVNPETYDPIWKKWNLNQLPLIPDSFKYEVVKSKAGHFKEVKKHLMSATEIIIATDPAREGELIARLILKKAGVSKKPLKRLWCSSMTEDAIKNAFQQLRPEESTKPFYHEALARSCSDWLVGINTSRAYTLLLQRKGISGVFSTGRVQTPLLSLIRRREEEIERFKPEKFWELISLFTTSSGEQYQGKHEEAFSDQKKGEAKLQEITGKPGIVVKLKTEKKSIKPPKLHSLSTLQTKMNRRYKFSPSRILEIVQKLYEKGYVSYPRTDSQHVTQAEAVTFPRILDKIGKKFPIPAKLNDISKNKRYVDDSKVSDHYAIIPTEQVPNLAQLESEDLKIYTEIAQSLIAAHCTDYIYNETTIITDVAATPFKTVGRQPLDQGWKTFFQDNPKEDPKEAVTLLPIVAKNETVQSDISLKEGVTKPPKPYTEGQLIQVMKTAGKHIEDEELLQDMKGMGIGTEATRANIIQTLKDREFIIVEKNTTRVTEKGKLLARVVDGTPLAKPDMTAKWEEYLYQIGKGTKSHIHFIERSKELTMKLIEDAKQRSSSWQLSQSELAIRPQSTKATSYKNPAAKKGAATPYESIGPCPRCGKNIVERKGFYGCTGYKEGCRFTLPQEYLGKKISKTNVKRLIEKSRSNLIKGFKSNKGTSFDAYLVLQNNKLSIEYRDD